MSLTVIPITQTLVKEILKKYPRSPLAHKGDCGHALIIGGQYGSVGAVVLATKGAYRTGSGKVTVYVPKCGVKILQNSVPEALVETDKNKKHITKFPNKLKKFNTITIGIGLGKDRETINGFRTWINHMDTPVLLDADALNILSLHKTLLKFIPPNSILTPHPGEFERLVGVPKECRDKQIEAQVQYSMKYKVIVVLKGHKTTISSPQGDLYENTSGNQALATAGTGDVLTGMITGLLAQGFNPTDASLVGVYLHGLAGVLASKELGIRSVMASDVLDKIGKAFCQLEDR